MPPPQNELSFFDRLEKITEYPGFGTEEKSAVSKYSIFTVYMSAFVLRARNSNQLKVPKRENFSLAFFALSEPIWVCDLGTGPKNPFFYHLTPDFERFWFFAAY